MPHPLSLPALVLALSACSGETSTTSGDSGTTSEDSGTTSTDQVNWYADVSPLLQTHCTRCHYTDGLGTGDFTDYDIASAMSEVLVTTMDAGLMPPPTSDPDCRDYQGSHQMHLPDGAIELVQAWVDADTPLGDVEDAIVIDAISENLKDPDLEIRISEPYEPTFSDATQPGNEYRCFVLSDVPEDDFYVTSMQPIIDQRTMAHHAVLYSIRDGALTDDHRKPEGFDCINGEEFRVISGFVGGWAPGSQPMDLPEGVAMKFKGGKELLLQIHYYDPGVLPDDAADHPGYAFKTTAAPDTIASFDTWGVYGFNIPAGEEAHTESSGSTTSSSKTTTIYSVFPHMHVLGSGFEMRATSTAGEETCLVDGDYQFNNQVGYYFNEPFVAEPGTQLDYSCTWNNSTSNPGLIHDPPRDTRYGERTDEEMCLFFGLTSTD